MTHYLITMEDGWKPGVCALCHMGEVCIAFENPDEKCPLANAREAHRVFNDIDGNTIHYLNDKPAKVYAVDQEDK